MESGLRYGIPSALFEAACQGRRIPVRPLGAIGHCDGLGDFWGVNRRQLAQASGEGLRQVPPEGLY